MKKVIEVKLPDGARFYSDGHDLQQAAEAAQRYLRQHDIASSTRPLTEFHEMTEEEYIALGGSSEATDFWDGCAENSGSVANGGEAPTTNSAIRKLLYDIHGYLGSGYESRTGDSCYKERINVVLAQLPE